MDFDFRRYVRDRLPSLDVPREHDIVEELAQHLEDLYRELRSSGLDHDQALARASEALTPAKQTAEELRSSSGAPLERALHRAASVLDTPPRVERGGFGLAGLLRDVRHALRGLLRAPGLAAIAVVTLALGIGATTVVYGVADALLLSKPPVRDPDRVVSVFSVFAARATGSPSVGDRLGGSSYPDYTELRDSDVLDGLAAFTDVRVALDQGDGAVRIEAAIVSGNYFDVLGVAAVLGRTLVPDDDRLEAPTHVAVLGYRTWQQRFGARPDVVGQTLRLNGSPYTVVGVAPRGFAGPRVGDDPEAWVPMALQTEIRPPSAGPLRQLLGGRSMLGVRDIRWLNVVGRLRPEQTVAAAAAALDVVGRRIAAANPETNRDMSASAVPLGSGPSLLSNVRPVLMLLGVAVALVLLVACANVASLLLARGLTRRHEVGVRMALGAGRAQVMRQWLVESVLLGLLGATAGCALAAWGTPLFHRFGIPASVELGINLRVLTVALLTGVLSGLVFGIAPAVQFVRRDAMAALRDAGAFVAAGGGSTRLRGALVVFQVALSVVLLLGAGLFLRTLQEAYALDLGYSVDRMLLVDVGLGERYDADQGVQLYADVLQRIDGLPGVVAAGAARVTVLSGSSRTVDVSNDGQPIRSDRGNTLAVRTNVVSQGYLAALGVPVTGRDFLASDRAQAPPVAIVSRSLGDRLWPGANPVGRMLETTGGGLEVVGVVPDTVYLRPTEVEPRPFYYTALSQLYENAVTLHVRTAGDPLALLPAVREAVTALDPRVEITNPRRLVDEFARSMALPRTLATLTGVLSGVAMLLAAVGLYGVMAYFVRQRTPEVALRVALGATRSSIAKLVIGRGARLVALGVVLGVGGAALGARLIRSLLFGVDATDPAAWIAVAVLLAVVGVIACMIPALRAVRVAPATVLRNL